MKYALVTGSTQGIGRAIGLKLLGEGYFVIFNYSQSEKNAIELKQLLEEKHPKRYSIIKANLSEPKNIESFCNQVIAISESIDIVVFNAGVTDRTAWDKIHITDWMRVMDTNVNIPVFILQSLYPHLNRNAHVLFIGSLLGEVPHSMSLSYGVSKSAVHALTKNLVKFFSDKKIRINSIAPGFIDSEWQKEKPQWLRTKIEDKIALKRFGRVEEVADLAFQLCQNQYINGQIIKIDGGYNFE